MKRDLSKYTKEVEETLNRLSLKNDREKADQLKKYIGTNLQVLGMISQSQSDSHKKGFSFHTDDKAKTFLAYHEVYQQSNIFEAKNLAFLYLDKNYRAISPSTQLKILPQWVKQIDNWAHSDTLSKFLTRLLENEATGEKMLSILKKWNRSKNLWERRQSLIALYYYARIKKKYVSFEQTVDFIKPLLHDKEYYVQKAVGWALRESYQVYPKQTFDFINQHVRMISPVAFTTSIEKMNDAQKQTLKQKRKIRRKTEEKVRYKIKDARLKIINYVAFNNQY